MLTPVIKITRIFIYSRTVPTFQCTIVLTPVIKRTPSSASLTVMPRVLLMKSSILYLLLLYVSIITSTEFSYTKRHQRY